MNIYEITGCLECGARVWRNVGREDRDRPRIKSLGWVFHHCHGGQPGWTCPKCSLTPVAAILKVRDMIQAQTIGRLDR